MFKRRKKETKPVQTRQWYFHPKNVSSVYCSEERFIIRLNDGTNLDFAVAEGECKYPKVFFKNLEKLWAETFKQNKWMRITHNDDIMKMSTLDDLIKDLKVPEKED